MKINSPSEAASIKFLHDLGVRDKRELLNLETLAWIKGLLVVEAEIDGADASLTIADGKGVVSVSAFETNPRRKRFSIAHEIGHFVMHRGINGGFQCQLNKFKWWLRKDFLKNIESQADQFASAFLMPEQFFGGMIDQQNFMASAVRVSDDFNVSLTAASIRTAQFIDDPCAVAFLKKGQIEWMFANPTLLMTEIRLPYKTAVGQGSLVSDFFKKGQLEADAWKVSAKEWFPDNRFEEDVLVNEETKVFKDYGTALSFLTFKDGIDFDN